MVFDKMRKTLTRGAIVVGHLVLGAALALLLFVLFNGFDRPPPWPDF